MSVGCVCWSLAAAVEPAQAQNTRLLQLETVKGYVQTGLRGRNEDRSRASAGTSAVVDELKIDETLNLGLDGFVYHPRFLTFRGELDLSLLQEAREGSNTVLPGGNWNLTFFREHPYSLSTYGDIRQREVTQQFSRTFDLDTEFYGASFRFRKGPLPFEISLDHRGSRRVGAGPETRQDGEFLTFLGNYELRPSSGGQVRYFGAREDVRTQKITRQRASISNTSQFGPDHRKTLTGNLTFRQQSDGGGDRFTAAAFADFDWKHTDSLSTRSRLDYQHDTINGSNTDFYSGELTLRHQLYESLATTADLFANHQAASSGTTTRFGGRLGESYSKRLGGWGRLAVGVGGRAEVNRQDPRETTGDIVDEQIVFSGALPVALAQLDILTGSIVVTDPSGAFRFLEGLDYQILARGRTTEIQRVPTGDIPPGGSVLVDYRFVLTGPSDILTRSIDLGARLSWTEWGAVYLRLLRSKEVLLSGMPNRPLEDRSLRVFGVTASRGWVTATVEYEGDDSIFRSFDQLGQSVMLANPSGARFRAHLSASHRYRRFTDADEQVRDVTIAAILGARLGRSWLLELESEYAIERWSGEVDPATRDFDGIGVTLAGTWRVRRIELKVGGTYSRTDRQGLVENLDRFFVRLRRYF